MKDRPLPEFRLDDVRTLHDVLKKGMQVSRKNYSWISFFNFILIIFIKR
jgi:hypothetical protein